MAASFLNHLEWRHATKAFDAKKPVTDANIQSVLQAVRMAPTSFGLQPFHVEVVRDQNLKDELFPHAWNQKQVTTCTALLVFVAHSNVDGRISEYFDGVTGGNGDARAQMSGYENMMRAAFNGRSEEDLKSWAQKQAYVALGFGLAACAELQIDSCPMEGIVHGEFDRILRVGKGHYSTVALAIGHRDPAVPPMPKFRFSEKTLFHKK